MLSLWQIMILAAVQGATEFLPVSSSGHLVIVAAMLVPDGDPANLDVPAVNVVLHAGTLLSILAFYSRRIVRLLGEDRRTLGLLAIGTLPAVLIGLPLREFAEEELLGNPLLAGCLLPITGLILLWLNRSDSSVERYEDLPIPKALGIGFSQAIAILPGLSRSGLTISTGIRLGLAPQSAATFSFLLAIPAIAGACVLELMVGLSAGETRTPAIHLLIGSTISFAVGLVCLKWLIRWIERGRLHYFAWWCIPAGLCVVVWQLFLV